MKPPFTRFIQASLVILSLSAALTGAPTAQAGPPPPVWFTPPLATLPNFTFQEPQTGQVLKFNDWRQNRPVVIATWAAFARNYADPGIQQGLAPVLHANPKSDVQVLVLRYLDLGNSFARQDESRLATHPLPFPVFGVMRAEFEQTEIPTFTFVNRNGQKVYFQQGFHTRSTDPLLSHFQQFIENESR